MRLHFGDVHVAHLNSNMLNLEAQAILCLNIVCETSLFDMCVVHCVEQIHYNGLIQLSDKEC